jgi:hypothetical protein
MTTWHIDGELLEEYDGGRLEPSRVMAVDAHLQACPSCRGQVRADDGWLTANWEAVWDTIHAPRPGVVHQLLGRAGLPDHRIRLLAATPALRRSWLVATAAVLAFAVAAAGAGQIGAQVTTTLFLVFAPILPVLAVATAYGPPADSMHEITGSSPVAGPSLVLWRAAAVVGVAVAMAMPAAVLLPGPGWFAVAWLLPALLLCAGSLALATVVSLPVGAGMLAGTWLLGVGAAATVRDGSIVQLVFGDTAQVGYLLTAVVAAAVVTVRRRRFDSGEAP